MSVSVRSTYHIDSFTIIYSSILSDKAEGSSSVCLMVEIFIITTINNKVEYVSEFYGLETFIAILYNHGIKHGRKRFFEIIDFYCK